MKLTIIGGAGARVPLLTNGILRFHSDLETDTLALWDIDDERRRTIATISRAMAERFGISLRIECPSTLEEAVEGADFVISSIRVGGTGGRILDEQIALKNGTLGQETVGAGGFALALRTIPVMLDYVRKVSRLAPHAWCLNFTNPVGIISQSMLEAGVGRRVIGICDTPREQFETLAHVLGVPLEETFFDYVGLNHLGWIRGIQVDGEERIQDLFDSSEKLSHAYRIPFFDPEFLRELGYFPTEYLYFYYHPDRAREKTRSSGQTRGQLVLELEKQLMRSVAENRSSNPGILEAYDFYLASRNATYMSVETGESVDLKRISQAREKLYKSAAGYERIAIDVMRAICANNATIMPVDVSNVGSVDDLEDEDAVEVPCVIDANGAHPLTAGHLPDGIRPLVLQVKEYERLTVEAALSGSAAMARKALSANPVIDSFDQASRIVDEYLAAHRPHLDYLE